MVEGNEKQEQVRAEYFDEGEVEAYQEQVPVHKLGNPTFGYCGRVRIAKLFEDHKPFLNKIITVAGWARNSRPGGKELMFIELTDGSCIQTLQVVIDSTIAGFDQIIQSSLGASFKLKGTLIKSPKQGQEFELQLSQPDKHTATLYGNCDPSQYPFAGKKAHSMEHLRDYAHLRVRTKLMSSIMRVRSSLAFATHQFFQGQGMQYLHSPIVTASDCEGAGEMFQVTTMLPKPGQPLGEFKGVRDPYQLKAERDAAKAKEEEKKQEKPEEEAKPAEGEGEGEGEQKMSKAQLKKLAKQKEKEKKKGEKGKSAEELQKQQLEALKKQEEEQKEIEREEAQMASGELTWKQFQIDYRKDFFHKPAFLTVSGQLSAENYACALGDVYTFGPTFRAEDSNTSRHLAEFWMIEPELSFINFEELKDCAEAYLKYCLKFVLENSAADIDFLDHHEKESVKKTKGAQAHELALKERLQHVIDTPFKRLTYTEAIELLKAEGDKPKFEEKVEWGIDLGSEHERYLVERIFKGPVILTDYPKDIKAFYMRLGDDGKTVQAMDVLAPAIGEIIGGSMREERLEILDQMIEEKGLIKEQYDWYRDLRKYGTVPHGGFGLGFERLVMMATGIENIRDVIPFPRFPGHAEF